MGWWAVQSVFQLFGDLPACLLCSSGICAQFSTSNWMFTPIFYFLRCLFLISVIILKHNCIKGSTLAVLIDGVCPLCVSIQTESHSKGSVVRSRGYQRSWTWTPGELNGWRLTTHNDGHYGLSSFPRGTFHYSQIIHYLLILCQFHDSRNVATKILDNYGSFICQSVFWEFYCVHVYLYRMDLNLEITLSLCWRFG